MKYSNLETKGKATTYRCVMNIDELLLQESQIWEVENDNTTTKPRRPPSNNAHKVATECYASTVTLPLPSWQAGGAEETKKPVFQKTGDWEPARLHAAKVEPCCTWPAEGAVAVAGGSLLPLQVNKNVKSVIKTLDWRRKKNYSCAALIWVEDIYGTLVDTFV